MRLEHPLDDIYSRSSLAESASYCLDSLSRKYARFCQASVKHRLPVHHLMAGISKLNEGVSQSPSDRRVRINDAIVPHDSISLDGSLLKIPRIMSQRCRHQELHVIQTTRHRTDDANDILQPIMQAAQPAVRCPIYTSHTKFASLKPYVPQEALGKRMKPRISVPIPRTLPRRASSGSVLHWSKEIHAIAHSDAVD